MLHATLWQANRDLAQACLELPFVQGLANGRLESVAFTCYVAQDAFFLNAFLRAYALAAAKSERLDQVATFRDLMGGVLEELELHRGYAQSLGIDLNSVEPLPAARAYTDFLLRVAWSAGVDEIVAAMTPCMRLYAWLGAELAPQLRAEHPYGDWIRAYSDPEFEALARGLEVLLDDIAADTPAVREAYRYAMVCERDFFAAPMVAT
ncbi:TenA family transcriptional regulator [Candidatus Entotheonella serta]|nr:TenA family transcriptional regulator [Candidatus Entotheonella serta]